MKSERGLMHLLVAVEVLILVAVVVFGVVKKVSGPEENTQIVISTQENQIDEFQDAPETETEDTQEEAVVVFSEEIEEMLAAMSTEEKVAQLFMVSPEALTGIDRVNVAGQGTRTALEQYPVGGMLYAKQNYMGRVQMRDLLTGAQAMSNEVSGRYLFAGALVTIGEEMFVVSAPIGQEDAMVELLALRTSPEEEHIAGMERIYYVQDEAMLSAERTGDSLYCYHVANGGQTAVDALNQGADMLCVTDGFSTVYEKVLGAVNSGEISESVLKQAVGRILVRKQALSQ